MKVRPARIDTADPVPYTGRNGNGHDPRRRVPTIDVGGDVGPARGGGRPFYEGLNQITVAHFGLAHLGNPNATLYGAAAIGIEAGMLLGAAYVVARRLRLAVGGHFGWKFMQAGVFGPNLFGRQMGSLLESRLSGPDLLSGGALGVEGSVFAIAVCLAASLFFLKRAQREGGFIGPFWRLPSAGST